jgi:putative endonuclease
MLDGEDYEKRSALLLENAGYRIVARRYRCRSGELDLVAENGRQLLFVEVRARARRSHGGAAASVDRKKQCKLTRCASLFLNRHPQWKILPCRFDVIAWEPRAAGRTVTARWIRAAFLS